MKTKYLVLIGIVITILILGNSFKNIYNGMVDKDETTNKQWANVENVYQRRADLIPNLVKVVGKYAEHEKETFVGVAEARTKVSQINIDNSNLTSENIQKFQAAQDGLSSALSKLMVVVEKYPELKANQGFLDLQTQLEGTENRITVERMNYNNVASIYNTYIRRFPKNIVALVIGFESKPYFKAKEGSDDAPEVQF